MITDGLKNVGVAQFDVAIEAAIKRIKVRQTASRDREDQTTDWIHIILGLILK